MKFQSFVRVVAIFGVLAIILGALLPALSSMAF
jgi:hypothetical protein